MVSVAGVNRKTYQEHFGRGQRLEGLVCPDPSCLGSPLHGHGFYRRYVDGSYMELRRVRCRRCRVTHIVLPEDLCAYRDLSFAVLEKVLSTAGGPTAVGRACGQLGEEGRRRVRRWLHSLRDGLKGAVQGFLPATSGDLWQRVQAVFGKMPGALVRLRRWLSATHGYFLGGLSDLYRHGRPRSHPRAGST